MQLTGDFHTHTPYSHGTGTVLENATRAKELGMNAIGITDHGFSHLAFGVKRKMVPNLKNDCALAQQKLGIKVMVGMECNILDEEGKTDLKEKDYPDFDLFLAGKHVFVAYNGLNAWIKYFGGNFLTDKLHLTPSKSLIKRNTKAYINLIKKNPIDIVTHIGYNCPADIVEVAKCARDYGTYLEINTKKQHITDEDLYNASQTGVRFLIDSDAHSVSRVGDTQIADEMEKRGVLPKSQIDNIEGRMPKFRFTEYKKEHNME